MKKLIGRFERSSIRDVDRRLSKYEEEGNWGGGTCSRTIVIVAVEGDARLSRY